MKMFGAAANFYGGPSEHNLKKFVKHCVQNTQQRAESFNIQVTIRNHEANLITWTTIV